MKWLCENCCEQWVEHVVFERHWDWAREIKLCDYCYECWKLDRDEDED